MNYAQSPGQTGLITANDSPTKWVSGGVPKHDRLNSNTKTAKREYHQAHVVKKLLVIVVMLLVIGQLVWTMG